MTEKTPLKQALNPERITRIGDQLLSVQRGFDAEGFTRSVLADFPSLELKGRIARTSQAIHDYLPATGPQALAIVVKSLPPTPEAAGISTDFGLHLYSPHSHYVAQYHRTRDQLPQALAALRQMTGYFSAEDAVRYFLTDFPEETMRAVDAWAQDRDHRVRRLASESTRPKLPWSPRIPVPIEAGLPVLDRLYADPSRYVTRSVANHLHDIAADQPDLALATLQRWKTTKLASDTEFTFIARQALRSRLKKGWPPAYELLGYSSDAPVELSPLRLEATELTDGETLAFTADLTSNTTSPLNVTYVISSTTQRGTPREKVYFLTRTTAEAGRPLQLAKRHPLRSTATTKITPGAYALQIQVNGRRFPKAPFEVVAAPGPAS